MKNIIRRKRNSIAALMALLLITGLISGFLTGCGKEKQIKKVENLDDLTGCAIGVQIGTTGDIYASDYEDDGKGSTVTRFNKGADAIQALKQNKINAVIIDEQPARVFVEKNKELKILDEEFAIEDYAICISKENQELKEKVNKAIDELKAEGTLESIIDNYINDSDNSKIVQYESPEGITRQNGTLTVATNVAFPPYEYYENGKAMGIDMDLAQAIADKLGMELKVTDIEFDSIIVAVQSGKADVGISGMTVTEDRLKNIDFSDSYTTAKQVVIVNTNDKALTSDKPTIVEKFKQCFIEDDRWEYIPKGLKTTVIITIFAGIMGIILGFIFAIIRVAYIRSESKSFILKVLEWLVKAYLSVFRGTPVLVQLMIMYYVVFASVDVNPVIAAVLAFGLNSAAYVSEAIRAGIMAIPLGQFEAGRSLGFTYTQTMIHIVLPQAVKNALPAMGNEFISLLKESSIVGYVGLVDVTKAGDIIRSKTYEAMVPLLAVALVYFVIVLILTKLVERLEWRLKKHER